MYKLLLCWRYLRTRYIALASIISVMLGVATMIVVNSVMSGFTSEMRNRIHSILSDVVFESRGLDGFEDPDWHMDQIRKAAGQYIEGMTPTVTIPAMLNFQFRGTWITQQVQLIGVDERTQGQVSDFTKYLQHPGNREQMSFQLRETGFDVRDHQSGPEAQERGQMIEAGWPVRRRKAEEDKLFRRQEAAIAKQEAAKTPAAGPADNPFMTPEAQKTLAPAEAEAFDPEKQQFTGAVLGIALSCHRDEKGKDFFAILPGEDIKLTFPTAGAPPKAVSDTFTVVDFYESKMSEYDTSFVFVPMRKLQELRGMINRSTGIGAVSSIQIKLKPGVDLDMVRDLLRGAFSPYLYGVYTWCDKQGPLLAAVNMETAILNVLLFLIIAVAGFGILAVFFMIVVEKTRDMGILKSLGASGFGILSIFLGYGFSLGAVGSGVGLLIGLLFVHHINGIANLLGVITGHPVFDPRIYYFYKIPTIINPVTIAWIVVGAMAIAVLASVLPALRAATLHPVEALRYE